MCIYSSGQSICQARNFKGFQDFCVWVEAQNINKATSWSMFVCHAMGKSRLIGTELSLNQLVVAI